MPNAQLKTLVFAFLMLVLSTFVITCEIGHQCLACACNYTSCLGYIFNTDPKVKSVDRYSLQHAMGSNAAGEIGLGFVYDASAAVIDRGPGLVNLTIDLLHDTKPNVSERSGLIPGMTYSWILCDRDLQHGATCLHAECHTSPAPYSPPARNLTCLAPDPGKLSRYCHGNKCVPPIKYKYLSNQLRFRVISTDRQEIEQRGMRCPFLAMYQSNLLA